MTEIRISKRTGKPVSRRGFASMTPERRAAISALGGKAQPAAARSFSKDRQLASAAGAEGGRKGKRGKKSENPA